MSSDSPVITGPRPELSVVVLCYRAGESARPFVARLEAALRAGGIENYELVLVGNYYPGSGDVTPEVVRALAMSDPRICCVALLKEGMMGWDARSGLRRATGRAVALLDGDGQVRVEDLIQAYQLLQNCDCDLVKTYRRRRGDGLRRKAMSLGFNALYQMAFPGMRVRDVNAKPKILTRAAYERLELKADDWFLDAEIMLQASRLGFRIQEVETDFLGLTGRRSFITMGAVVEFIRNLVIYRWREWRRRGLS